MHKHEKAQPQETGISNVRRREITGKEIEAWRFVLHRQQHLKLWESLYEYYNNSNDISEIKLSVLEKLVNDRLHIPSLKQTSFLYRLYQDAVKNGWSPNEK
jgi:hypothetical protein